MVTKPLDDDQTAALQEWIEASGRLRTLQHEAKQTERLEALRALASQHTTLSAERTRLEALTAEHEKAAGRSEKEADDLRDRIARTEARLNAGTGLTSRDLMGLQEEIAGLKAKVDDVEGVQVEALEAAEESSAALQEATASAEDVSRQGAQLQKDRADEAQRLSEAVAGVESERAALLDRLPPALHGRLRREGGYPSAAIAHAGACGACGAQLSGGSADTYRNLPAGGTMDCEECEALLLKLA